MSWSREANDRPNRRSILSRTRSMKYHAVLLRRQQIEQQLRHRFAAQLGQSGGVAFHLLDAFELIIATQVVRVSRAHVVGRGGDAPPASRCCIITDAPERGSP